MDVIPALAMDAVSAVVVATLCLWFAVTVLNATERADDLLRPLGPLSTLVPSWNFFSPHPGRYDNYLFYRDRRVDGSLTDWRKVDAFDRTPRHFGWLWNPYIYESKALFDAAEWLKREVTQSQDGDDEPPADAPADRPPGEPPTDAAGADGPPLDRDHDLQAVELGHVELSVLYLSVLNYVTCQEHSRLSEATQFMLMRHSRSTDHYEPMFVSNFHEL